MFRLTGWMLLFTFSSVLAQEAFKIRGTLPWHNFLCGPTGWNEEDYEHYLDRLAEMDMNFIGFHCYTGGPTVHALYVEPLVKVSYLGETPVATFDRTDVARWGNRSMLLDEFPENARKALGCAPDAQVYGPENSLSASDKEAHYQNARDLFSKVIDMAHARGIRVALGFELGVYPLDIQQLISWQRRRADPTDPIHIRILHNTIDYILESYPDLDYIWLWQHELVQMERVNMSPAFRKEFDEKKGYFEKSGDEKLIYDGVWAAAYIQKAYDYIQRKAPEKQIIIGGWGAEFQINAIFDGLNILLPKDIIFTALNPKQGQEPHTQIMTQIAKDRNVWAVPWLEADYRLWYYIPRIALMKDQVVKAWADQLDGVVALHWRTEETRLNMASFNFYGTNPQSQVSPSELIQKELTDFIGKNAAAAVAPLITELENFETLESLDAEFNLPSPVSPIYWPYESNWCRQKEGYREINRQIIQVLENQVRKSNNKEHTANMQWLSANFETSFLLEQITDVFFQINALKEQWLAGSINHDKDFQKKISEAQALLESVPLEKLEATYASRIRSQGEKGVYCSMVRRIWPMYNDLKDFIDKCKSENN